jgi:nicotinate-nucleotide adenylyltransferase
MKLGIFGGSFDPVHYGHLLLAESCREQLNLDKVFFVPAGLPPHKRGAKLTPAIHRLAMLELAIGGEPGFEICRFEIDRQETSYTVETLRWFRTQFQQAELFLLVGADMLNDLPNWREADEICRLAQPVGVRRGGSAPPSFERLTPLLPPERLEWLKNTHVDMPEVALSSSEIRRRVRQQQSIRFRVPKAVEQYILTHGLYRDSVGENVSGETNRNGCQ